MSVWCYFQNRQLECSAWTGAVRYKFKALGYYKEQKAYSNSWKWHVAGPANGTIMASN